MKRLTCIVLALTLALGVFIVPSDSVEAKSKKKSKTQTMNMHLNFNTDAGIATGSMTYYYKNAGDSIKTKSLKSSSKDLIVKQTYQKDVNELMQYFYEGVRTYEGSQYNSLGGITEEDANGNTIYVFANTPSSRTNSYAFLNMCAKKAGTYTVSFDVVGANGKKRYTQKITVVVDDKEAVASISFAGKKLNVTNASRHVIYTTKKKGKLNVKMNKGYKLKRIQYIAGYQQKVVQPPYEGAPSYIEEEPIVYQIKNNKKISLPAVSNLAGDAEDYYDQSAVGVNKEDWWDTGRDAEGNLVDKKYTYSYWRKTFAKNFTTVQVVYKDNTYAKSEGLNDSYGIMEFDIYRLGK